MLLAIFGLGLPPQQQVQPASGVLTLNLIPGTSSFKVILSANVTSVVIQNPTPGTIISVIFTENATGGFTVAFGGNIANPCTVSTTASATTTCQFQYDATSNTWNGIGGGGGGGLSSKQVILSQQVGFAGPAQYVCDAGITNNSNIVTTPATDVPFTGGTNRSAQAGDIVWGGTFQCGGELSATNTVLIAQGTITSVDSAHQVHVSNNASATCTVASADGCVFVWGPDGTTGGQNAWVNVNNQCGTLEWDALIIMQSVPTTASALCPTSGAGNDANALIEVYGHGNGTGIILSPAVTTFSTQLFNTPASTIHRKFHDFILASFAPATASMNGQTAWNLGFNSDVYGIEMLDFFPSTTQRLIPLAITGVAGSTSVLRDSRFYDAGAGGINISGGSVNTSNLWFQGSALAVGYSSTTTALQPELDSNNTWSLDTAGPFGFACFATFGVAGILRVTNDFISCSGAGNTVGTTSTDNLFFTNTFIGASGTGNAFQNVAGSTVSFDGSTLNVAAGSGLCLNNAGTVTMRNTTCTGAAAANSLTNSGTLNIKEGNSFVKGITNTGTINVVDGAGGYTGACTGTVTSASTVFLYGLGQTTASTCTATAQVGGKVMTKPGTAYALYCTAGTGGNQAADACTLVKNGAAQTMTCSLNGVTSCTDGTAAHQIAYVQGDILAIEVIAGTGTTLANVKGTMVAQ